MCSLQYGSKKIPAWVNRKLPNLITPRYTAGGASLTAWAKKHFLPAGNLSRSWYQGHLS
jgi:hypothetical protein